MGSGYDVLESNGLTLKEVDVARKILEGKGNKEIANELGCSPKTVELHATRLFRKVGVRSRLELACKFLARSRQSQ